MAEQIVIDASELKAMVAKLRDLDEKVPAQALRRAGHTIGEKLIKLLLAPTSTWKHKPKMTKLVRVSTTGVVILVKIDDEPYIWVTLGTRVHAINPRRVARLAFQSGYSAKTTPGQLTASGGGSFGPVVYSMGVLHPGIEPRNFHLTAFEQIKPEAILIIRDELEAELRRMGAS